MTAENSAAEPFWRFSLMVYARPGVADALIRLQERGGHNVNLILFGMWLAVGGVRLDVAGVVRARAAMAGIEREVVLPLRRLRGDLKGHPDPDIAALRRRVLAVEIAAERLVQARLAASVARRRAAKTGDRAALAAANLRLILGGDFESTEGATILRAIAEA